MEQSLAVNSWQLNQRTFENYEISKYLVDTINEIKDYN